jgi:hypothetical protein
VLLCRPPGRKQPAGPVVVNLLQPCAAGLPISLRINDPALLNLTAGAVVTVRGSVEGEDADIDFLLEEQAEDWPADAGSGSDGDGSSGSGGSSSGSGSSGVTAGASASAAAHRPDLVLHVDSLMQQASGGGEQEKSLLASSAL